MNIRDLISRLDSIVNEDDNAELAKLVAQLKDAIEQYKKLEPPPAVEQPKTVKPTNGKCPDGYFLSGDKTVCMLGTAPVNKKPEVVVKKDPVVTNPVVTNPVVTNPVVTNPVVTNPVVKDPAAVTPNDKRNPAHRRHTRESLAEDGASIDDQLGIKPINVNLVQNKDGTLTYTGPDGKPVTVDKDGKIINQDSSGINESLLESFGITNEIGPIAGAVLVWGGRILVAGATAMAAIEAYDRYKAGDNTGAVLAVLVAAGWLVPGPAGWVLGISLTAIDFLRQRYMKIADDDKTRPAPVVPQPVKESERIALLRDLIKLHEVELGPLNNPAIAKLSQAERDKLLRSGPSYPAIDALTPAQIEQELRNPGSVLKNMPANNVAASNNDPIVFDPVTNSQMKKSQFDALNAQRQSKLSVNVANGNTSTSGKSATKEDIKKVIQTVISQIEKTGTKDPVILKLVQEAKVLVGLTGSSANPAAPIDDGEAWINNIIDQDNILRGKMRVRVK
jgi:hypothetical protein